MQDGKDGRQISADGVNLYEKKKKISNLQDL